MPPDVVMYLYELATPEKVAVAVLAISLCLATWRLFRGKRFRDVGMRAALKGFLFSLLASVLASGFIMRPDLLGFCLYLLAEPAWAAVAVVAISLPFVVWRLLLGGARFREFGMRPLLNGYLLSLVASVIGCGLWIALTPDWTTGWWVLINLSGAYGLVTFAGLIPALGVLMVPVAAGLLRVGRLSKSNIAVATFAIWVFIAVAHPKTVEDRLNLETTGFFVLLALVAIFFVVPFLSGIYLKTRSETKQ